MNRVMTYVVRAILAFSIIGLGYMAFTSPESLLRNIATFVIFGAIFVLIVRFLISGSNSSTDAGYKRALKQSKKRMNQLTNKQPNKNRVSNKKTTIHVSKKKTRDASHLTVIEGKKNTKKQA